MKVSNGRSGNLLIITLEAGPRCPKIRSPSWVGVMWRGPSQRRLNHGSWLRKFEHLEYNFTLGSP